MGDAAFDQRDYRNTMGEFCTGVVIATGAPGGQPAGFAAQSFVSLSLDPPLVALCPANTSTSWPRLRDAGHFCINVLSSAQEAICLQFARSGGDKFAGIDWRPGPTGAPILPGVLAWVDCELEREVPAGDHVIAIGRVRAYGREDGPEPAAPLLFFRGGYGDFQPGTA